MSSSLSGHRKLLPRRWRLGLYLFAWLLLAIIVLQNLEPTRLDVLFWSFGEVPKLVLVLGSMIVGIFLWELGRLLASRSRKSGTE
jgi:uncharacterized integral membrane protein